MKHATLLLLLLVLAGCNEPPSSGEPGQPKDTPPKDNSMDSPSKQVEEPPKKDPEIPPSLKKHPDRINALEAMPESTITVENKTFKVWIANEPSTQAEGMMYLDKADVPDDRGMFFVFPEERSESQSFWMQNTVLPLDIIYVGKDLKVVSVGNGVPFSEEPVMPGGRYQYVLELKRGTAAAAGIRKGSTLSVPAKALKS